jgi:hypothetical protein
LKTGRFNQEKTGAFSRVLLTVKMGRMNWSCGTPGWTGMKIWPKIKGVPDREKATRFFRENFGDLLPLCFQQARNGIQRAGYSGF